MDLFNRRLRDTIRRTISRFSKKSDYSKILSISIGDQLYYLIDNNLFNEFPELKISSHDSILSEYVLFNIERFMLSNNTAGSFPSKVFFDHLVFEYLLTDEEFTIKDIVE